jgi:hypothetical protein
MSSRVGSTDGDGSVGGGGAGSTFGVGSGGSGVTWGRGDCGGNTGVGRFLGREKEGERGGGDDDDADDDDGGGGIASGRVVGGGEGGEGGEGVESVESGEGDEAGEGNEGGVGGGPDALGRSIAGFEGIRSGTGTGIGTGSLAGTGAGAAGAGAGENAGTAAVIDSFGRDVLVLGATVNSSTVCAKVPVAASARTTAVRLRILKLVMIIPRELGQSTRTSRGSKTRQLTLYTKRRWMANSNTVNVKPTL